MANYKTLDYLPDLSSASMANATLLVLEPYTSTNSGIDWDNKAYYSTSKDYAILNDDFKWNATEGAVYDIVSTSYFDPFIVIVYDNLGKAIKTGESSYEGSYGSDWVWNFVAPYTGTFYVSASWDQGNYYKSVSLSIYEDIDTAVIKVNNPPTGIVTVSGEPTQNQALTATHTLADVNGLGIVNYQWLADGNAISGATSSTLTLSQAQVGKAISVKVSYTDTLGTAEAVTSSATATVTNVNDSPTGSVTISGTATQGQTLTASNTLADMDGMGKVSYQWLANSEVISGATSPTLTLSQQQVGKTISVKASYTDAQGTVEAVTSSATSMVANSMTVPTTQEYLVSTFGITLQQAGDWVIQRLSTPHEIHNICANHGVTSNMLGDIVQPFFPDIVVTGVVVNEWLQFNGQPVLI